MGTAREREGGREREIEIEIEKKTFVRVKMCERVKDVE